MHVKLSYARGGRSAFRLARAIILALITPLFEKNPVKVATFSRCYVPLVLSMARVIVLLFAVFMLAQVKRHGIVGWPEATLCIAIVLALPLLNALERVSAHETIAVAKSLFGRFGIGAARGFASGYEREPSKLDDHRADSAEETPVLEEAA